MTNWKGLVRWGRGCEGRGRLVSLLASYGAGSLRVGSGSAITLREPGDYLHSGHGKAVINNSDGSWCQSLGIVQGRYLPSLGTGYPLPSRKTGQLWERNGLRI